MTAAYPLTWPKEWPRTRNPGSSQFKTTISAALNNVEKSLEMFSKDSGKKIENLIISSNVTLGSQRLADTGVACYFTWDGMQTCIAVDRYAKVEDNLQAIHHCLEAERTKLRHGGINLVRAAFRGYAALPPPRGRQWHDVLEISPDASLAQMKEAYNNLAKIHHPDQVGGNAQKMSELNNAYDEAKRAKS